MRTLSQPAWHGHQETTVWLWEQIFGKNGKILHRRERREVRHCIMSNYLEIMCDFGKLLTFDHPHNWSFLSLEATGWHYNCHYRVTAGWPVQTNNYHQMFNTSRHHIILMMTVWWDRTVPVGNNVFREIYQKLNWKLRISFLLYQECEQLELV